METQQFYLLIVVLYIYIYIYIYGLLPQLWKPSGLHINFLIFLSGFKQIWIFSTDFLKVPSIKCHGNTSSEGCADSADRRTDMRRDLTKLIALFATTWTCVQSCRLCCVYLHSLACTAIVYRTGQSPASYDEVPGASPAFQRRKKNISEKWSRKRFCNSFIPDYKRVSCLQDTFT